MVSNDLKKKKAKTKIRAGIDSDIILYKLIAAFLMAVVAVSGMLSAMKNISNKAAFITYVLPVLLVVSGAGAVGAAVLFALRKSRHTNDMGRIFTKWNILGAAIVFFGACVYYRLTFDATMVVIGIIAATALYFVYHIFKIDFFIYSAVTALGILLLKMGSVNYYTSFGGIVTSILLGTVIAIAVSALIFAVLLIIGKGNINIGDRKFVILNENGHIYPIILSSVLIIAGGIVGYVASSFVIYVIAALLIAYLAIAVIYSIKMM